MHVDSAVGVETKNTRRYVFVIEIDSLGFWLQKEVDDKHSEAERYRINGVKTGGNIKQIIYNKLSKNWREYKTNNIQ